MKTFWFLRENSVSEQFLERLAGLGLPEFSFLCRHKFPTDEIKILAKICHVLFSNWLGTAVPALVCDARLITEAIQTNFQV